MTPEQLKKLKEVFTIVTESISRAEFTEAFKTVTSLVLDTERKVVSKADSAIKELKDTFNRAKNDLEEGNLSDFASLKQSLSDAVSKALREQESGMNFIRDKARQITKGKEGERGPAGPPGKDGKDAIETPESVRDKLESLKDEERLDASAVKNLPQFVEQTGTKAGWGAHPLVIEDDGVVIDKVARRINFIGDVTRDPDGTVNVTLGGGGEPASPDTSVQFNDGGSFGGDSAFLWDKSNNILLLGLENLTGAIAGKDASSLDTSGAELALSGGNPNGAANGSGVTITGSNGGATSGSGGSISLTAGSAQGGDSDGGNVLIAAGTKNGSGTDGYVGISSSLSVDLGAPNVFITTIGGNLQLSEDGDNSAVFDTAALLANRTFTFPDTTGTFVVSTPNAGTPSDVTITAGNSSTATQEGGDITVTAGTGTTTGTGGDLTMTAGNGGNDAAGGDVTITAGAAGGGNNDGGDVNITAGENSNSGVAGQVKIVSANDSELIVGTSISLQSAESLGGPYALLDTSSIASTDKTFTFPNVTGQFKVTGMDTMTYAATISLDTTLADLHKTTTVNATGNATINASTGGVAGQVIRILITNDATSGKTITFGTNFLSTGTIVGTASKSAIIEFASDGTSFYEVARTLNL